MHVLWTDERVEGQGRAAFSKIRVVNMPIQSPCGATEGAQIHGRLHHPVYIGIVHVNTCHTKNNGSRGPNGKLPDVRENVSEESGKTELDESTNEGDERFILGMGLVGAATA